MTSVSSFGSDRPLPFFPLLLEKEKNTGIVRSLSLIYKPEQLAIKILFELVYIGQRVLLDGVCFWVGLDKPNLGNSKEEKFCDTKESANTI